MSQIVGHFINGEVVVDESNTQPVFNPSTGEISKQVSLGGAKTIDEAVASAKAAFPSWSKTPPLKRARIMFKFKELLEQNTAEICRLIGEEHGKIIHDAAGELQRGIENVEYACGAPELLKGEHSRNVGPNIDSWVSFIPRCSGWYYTIQLSCNGAVMDVPNGNCMWKHFCPKTF